MLRVREGGAGGLGWWYERGHERAKGGSAREVVNHIEGSWLCSWRFASARRGRDAAYRLR